MPGAEDMNSLTRFFLLSVANCKRLPIGDRITVRYINPDHYNKYFNIFHIINSKLIVLNSEYHLLSLHFQYS